jgi:hypothetical protein
MWCDKQEMLHKEPMDSCCLLTINLSVLKWEVSEEGAALLVKFFDITSIDLDSSRPWISYTISFQCRDCSNSTLMAHSRGARWGVHLQLIFLLWFPRYHYRLNFKLQWTCMSDNSGLSLYCMCQMMTHSQEWHGVFVFAADFLFSYCLDIIGWYVKLQGKWQAMLVSSWQKWWK